MSIKSPRFLIIDGNALVHRCFHALPPLTTSKGVMVNAVYGFATSLLKSFTDIKPDYTALTFDLAAPTFRHEEYKEYKATRVKQPDELYEQIPLVKKLVRAFDIPIYEKEGYEADDVIGTLIKKSKAENPNIKITILTGDMDTLQLVDDNTEVYTLRKGIRDTVTYDEKMVNERYGLKPEQIIDLKSLAGDASDNIPGVKGIGEKTAIDLIKKFGSLENLLKELEKNSSKVKDIKQRVRDLIKDQKKNAILSKKLATIYLDVPLNFNLEEARMKPIKQDEIVKLLQEFEFKSLLSKIPGLMEHRQKSLFSSPAGESDFPKAVQGYILLDSKEKTESFIKKLAEQEIFTFDTESTDLNPFNSSLIGISFSWKKGEAFYLPRKEISKNVSKALKEIFENEKISKIGHNLKFDMEMMKDLDIEVQGIYFDTMVAAYLINPGSRGYGLDNLAFVELGHRMIPIEALIGKGKNQISLADVELERVSQYSCEDADLTHQLYGVFIKELKKKNLWNLFEKMEIPLIYTLVAMETDGVKIDGEFLLALSKKYKKKVKELETKIYSLAGKEFNINSPLQLKDILFNTLKISTEDLRKTKTGISTSASELKKMAKLHPIINLVSEYRELAKLISTYLEALPELINPKTKRVHTSYNQTIAATGRLSSSDPNLQNIPIRTEIGREIRKAFVAEKGREILAADYSQIELRVIASLANDKTMIQIFKDGKDIHQATAAEIFGYPLEKVTPEIRRRAKEVNFGVLYGMGAYGLAERTGISREEARAFIEKYFVAFSGVKKYIDETLMHAREKGYVETLFGRIREIPEINSGVQQVQAAAERTAVNMPIQGTAADLIKLAMIKIKDELAKNYPDVKMIMQVHDELVFEVPTGDIKKVAGLVKNIMENIYELRVPIEVHVEHGKNWDELVDLRV